MNEKRSKIFMFFAHENTNKIFEYDAVLAVGRHPRTWKIDDVENKIVIRCPQDF